MNHDPQSHNGNEIPVNDAPSEPIAPPRPRARFIFRAQKPTVTITLIVFTVLVYIGQLLSQNMLGGDYLFAFGGKINEYIQLGQYWRLITPIFLHGSITHIMFNMYALYVIGRGLELYYGHLEYTILYFISGIGGTLFSYYLTTAPSLGASGAIFGLIAADAIMLYKNKEILGPGAKNMLQRSVMIIVVNLIIGLSPGIDNWGHVGGMVVGIVFAWFAGPMVSIERTSNEILIKLKSNLSSSIRVASVIMIVIIGLLVFKTMI